MERPSIETIGRLVRLGRERQRRDLEEGYRRGIYYDEKAAQHAVDFFPLLRHSKGEWAGKTFKLSPWQEHDIIRPLFGWKRADGTRRFRTGYISVARKNGKTTLLAGLGLYLTVADKEPGAEVYTAATKRDQARIMHSEAIRMVKASPPLRKFAQIFRNSISVLRTASSYEPLGADADTSDGLNVHGALVDELHAHKTRDMWDILDTGTGARRQPLILAITTAGSSRHTICWEQYDHAVKVLEGSLEDDSFFAYIAEIDKGDEWKDPACWVKANPNLGISVKLDNLKEQCERAGESPAFQNTFRRLRLNEWTEQVDRYIDMDAWRECSGHVDQSELRGLTCYGGLDLSSTTDLTAFALTFPLNREGRKIYQSLWWFWLPAEGMSKRVKRDNVPYDVWAERGWIKLTPGNVVDYDVVRADIKSIRDRHKIKEIAYDPWNATEIATKLQGDGLTMVEFRQGFKSMSEPTKSLAGMILDRRFEHGSNPVVSWMASNLAIAQDPAGNLKPDKHKSTEKIDGIVAVLMAVGRAMLLAEKRSIYQSRGVITA